MNKYIVAGVALALMSSGAVAQDFSGDDWSGFHAGIFGGFGSGTYTASITAPPTSQSIPLTGAMLGVAVGVDEQWNMFVLGAEADLAWSGLAASAACTGVAATCAGNVAWIGTVRGRAGLAFDQALLYVTAGIAVGGVTASMSPNFGTGSGSYTDKMVGWTGGVGGEISVTEDVSLRAEYAYTDLGSRTAPANTISSIPVNVAVAFHSVKFGANFQF